MKTEDCAEFESGSAMRSPTREDGRLCEIWKRLGQARSPTYEIRKYSAYREKKLLQIFRIVNTITKFQPWQPEYKEKTCRFLDRQKNGADDGARTRYLHLGKVALYQMSYIRISWCLRPESNQRHVDFQSTALPTELQRQKEKMATRNGLEPSTSSVTG